MNLQHKKRIIKLAEKYKKTILKQQYEKGYVEGYIECEKTFSKLKK